MKHTQLCATCKCWTYSDKGSEFPNYEDIENKVGYCTQLKVQQMLNPTEAKNVKTRGTFGCIYWRGIRAR